MRTSNGLDAVHIRMVAAESLLHRRRGAAQTVVCEPDGDRVQVRVLQATSLLPVETALWRVGYALDTTIPDIRPNGRRLRTYVTGWSTDGLRERHTNLGAAIEILESSFGNTVDRALTAYREARSQVGWAAAPTRAQQSVIHPMYLAIRQDAGSLTNTPTASASPDVETLLRENNVLCDRVLHLLRQHERLATEAIGAYVENIRTMTHAQAVTRAVAGMVPRLTELREEIERQDDHNQRRRVARLLSSESPARSAGVEPESATTQDAVGRQPDAPRLPTGRPPRGTRS